MAGVDVPPLNSPQAKERVERLVRETDGGAFVLFTSFRMLDRVAATLRRAVAGPQKKTTCT